MKQYKTLTVFIATAIILCASCAFAVEKNQAESAQTKISLGETDNSLVDNLNENSLGTNNDQGYAKELLVSVIFIFVLGSIAYAISKKLLPSFANKQSQNIQIKETTRLGAGKNLHIIEVDGEGRFLIGSTNSSISMISKLSENNREFND